MTERPQRPGSKARRGVRRSPGSPVGPDQVRRAVLDGAARLFAEQGVHKVSLRAIAAEADVDLSLIRRYIGSRAELVSAVFDDLSDQLAVAVRDDPLAGQGHGTDTVMGKWVRLAAVLAISGEALTWRPGFNPVLAMARTLEEGYGLDAQASRLRATQIVAAALGWRIFEDYLVVAGELTAVPLTTLREELVHSARRLGATPWPSPPDPSPQAR
jgi:TetR/AcrR family transcriptional regulator, repressor for neighboring sulfatase